MASTKKINVSNTDLCLFAMYQLESYLHPVDVEEIYLKLFEFAPKKFAWRTRPDLPNFQAAHTTLGRLEKTLFPEFIVRSTPNTRMLSNLGQKWIEHNIEKFASIGAPESFVLPSRASADSKLLRDLHQSEAWTSWENGEPLSLEDLADAFGCSPASHQSVWESRLNSISEAARVLEDASAERFATDARLQIENELGL